MDHDRRRAEGKRTKEVKCDHLREHCLAWTHAALAVAATRRTWSIIQSSAEYGDRSSCMETTFTNIFLSPEQEYHNKGQATKSPLSKTFSLTTTSLCEVLHRKQSAVHCRGKNRLVLLSPDQSRTHMPSNARYSASSPANISPTMTFSAVNALNTRLTGKAGGTGKSHLMRLLSHKPMELVTSAGKRPLLLHEELATIPLFHSGRRSHHETGSRAQASSMTGPPGQQYQC